MRSHPSDEFAAFILAKAIADAINPTRPARFAYIGNALLQPLAVNVVALLADQGYRLEHIPPDRAAA